MRAFTWKKDFELVRAFLILTHNLTRSFQNWIPSMFENIKFGPCGTEYRDEEDEYIKIWGKTDNSDIPTVSKPVRALSRVVWIKKLIGGENYEFGNEFYPSQKMMKGQ